MRPEIVPGAAERLTVSELRDRFAIAALPAILAGNFVDSYRDIAGRAFQMADAMLEARNK